MSNQSLSFLQNESSGDQFNVDPYGISAPFQPPDPYAAQQAAIERPKMPRPDELEMAQYNPLVAAAVDRVNKSAAMLNSIDESPYVYPSLEAAQNAPLSDGNFVPDPRNYSPVTQSYASPSFSDKSPLAQFQDLATEAYHPGTYSGMAAGNQPQDDGINWDEPPVGPAPAPYQIPQMPIHNENGFYAADPSPDQNGGSSIQNYVDNMNAQPSIIDRISNVFGHVTKSQQGMALTKWAQAQGSNNPQIAQIADLMAHDSPRNAHVYIPALIAAQQGEPELQHRQQIQKYMQSIDGGGNSEMTPEEKMAVHIASIDPTPANISAVTSAFGKRDAHEKTSEIKNYEYQQTHPDFITSKTASGQMSSFKPDSPFQIAQANGVTGDALIDTVPDKNVQNIARQLLRGDEPFFNVTSKTPLAQKTGMEVAQAADPAYSSTTAVVRKKNAEYFAPSGQGGQLLSSVKAIAKHINTMTSAQQKLNNSGMLPGATLENYLVNNASRLWDNDTHSALNSLQEAANNVAPELAKVISGKTNVPEEDVKEQRKVFSAYDGNEAFGASARTAAEMVAARAQIMLDNHRQAMGDNSKPSAPSLDKATVESFKKLGVNLEDYFDTSPSGSSAPKQMNFDAQGNLIP